MYLIAYNIYQYHPNTYLSALQLSRHLPMGHFYSMLLSSDINIICLVLPLRQSVFTLLEFVVTISTCSTTTIESTKRNSRVILYEIDYFQKSAAMVAAG